MHQLKNQGLEKATVTIGTPSTTTGLLYNTADPNGSQLWSYCAGDVISEVVDGGSPLVQWIPAIGTNVWNENVAHLSWIAPDGFDGAETYMDYITEDANPAECEYGEGAMDFNICEYSHNMFRVSTSNKNQPLNRFHFGGMRHCDKEPQLRVRGELRNTKIDNDAEWILSLLGVDLEEFINWNAINGDPSIPSKKGMYDGLENILNVGWVKGKAVVDGSCLYTDPIVISGTNITTARALLMKIWYMVRRLRRRMSTRNFRPSGADMIVSMSSAHWELILDELALGALTPGTQASIQFTTTPEVYQRQREMFSGGGVGFGYLPFPEGGVPVIIEEALGSNTELLDGTPSVTGDVYVLTRRFKSLTILEHQFLDWNKIIDMPAPGVGNSTVFQNGMLRASWQEVNSLCYYYGIEMYGRIVSRMQFLQGKITDVTLELPDELERIEAASYTHQDFYAYEGNMGGGGTAFLTPIN